MGAVGSRRLGGTMVAVLYGYFRFCGLCVCVFWLLCVKRRLFSWGPPCKCMCCAWAISIFTAPFFSSFGISFIVLLDMQSLEKTVEYRILPMANMRRTYEGIAIYVDK